jgi:hypothetical protein
MNGRLAVFAVAVSLGVAFAWLESSGVAGASRGPLVLRVGDTVRIEGTKVGCAVATRQGETMVECLPTTRKVGSYATLAGDERVLVVRFTGAAVARTIFHARQNHSHPTVCG